MGKRWGNALGGFRLQKRDGRGRFTYKSGGKSYGLTRAGAVPYLRKSLRSTTYGVNAGAQISKKRRVSAGFYVRSERIQPSNLEKRISAADRKVMDTVVGRVSPSKALDPYVEAGVRKLEREMVDRTVGKQHGVLGSSNATGRMTTTRTGMPSYTIRFGEGKRSERAHKASRKAQWAYNDQIASGKKVKKSRPQRRGKK